MSVCIHMVPTYETCFKCFPPEHKEAEINKDARIAELESWKSDAIAALSEWDAVFDSVKDGAKNGVLKASHVAATIAALRERIALLESLLKRAYGYTTAADDLLPEEIKAYFAEKGDE